MLVRAIAPFALEKALETLAADSGLQLEIGDIDLGLLEGTVAVSGLRVGVPTPPGVTPDPPLVEIGRLRADLTWRDLLANRVRLSSLRIDETRVRLTERADGTLVLPQALTGGESTGEASAASAKHDVDSAQAAVARQEPAPESDGREELPDSEPAPSADPPKSWDFAIDQFELNATDLALQRVGRDGAAVQLTLSRFVLNAFTLGPEGTGVGHIDFDGPDLRVERDWLLGEASAPETVAGDSADTTPAFRLEHFALNDGRFQIHTLQGPLEVGVRVEVRDLSTAVGHAFPIELVLRSEEGSVAVKGQLTLSPLAYQGQLSWSGLNAPPYLLITNPGLVPWIQSAEASGDFEVTFRLADSDAGLAGLTLRGRTGFENLTLKDPDSDDLSLYAKRFDVEVREAIYPLEPSIAQPRRIDVTRLLVESPRVVFTNPPEALDRFLALYTGVEAEPDRDLTDTTAGEAGQADDISVAELPEQIAEPQSIFISVDKFELSGGQLHVVDRTVSPTHETRLGDLLINASGVALSPVLGAEALKIEGLIQKTGAFTLRGSLPNGQGKLQFELRRLDLVSYDSFAKQAGWHVDSGSASLESAIRIVNNEYAADNELVLHDLRVDTDESSEFSSSFGHSLDFALALLRGPSGDIELSIPLAWNSDGLGVGLRRTLISAFRGALVGAIASPLKLAGGLLTGSDRPASLEPIGFQPGSSALTTESLARVESLAALLVDRPRLAIEIRGQLSSADGPILAARLIREDALEGRSFPDVDGAGLLANRRVANALRDRAAGNDAALKDQDVALLARFVAARVVPREAAEALARARESSVGDALAAAGVPPGSVNLGGSIDAEAPGVSLELHLRPQSDDHASENAPG